jgi:hypothetical protein
MVLIAGEQITSIFGNADQDINSIGFTTSSGTEYGPWGGPEGFDYSIYGPIYGLHGALRGNVLGALGTWTTDPPDMRTPTSAPSPTGMTKSKMFGSSLPTDSEWDDGSTFPGKPSALSSIVKSAVTLLGH